MWPFGCFDTGSCYVGLDVRKPMVQTKLVSFFCCFSCLSPLSSVIIGVCRHTPFFSILCKGGEWGVDVAFLSDPVVLTFILL